MFCQRGKATYNLELRVSGAAGVLGVTLTLHLCLLTLFNCGQECGGVEMKK